MLEILRPELPAYFVKAEKKQLSFWAYLFLFFVCLAFFVPGIVSLPATDRDEASFAQASKQMIETKNYIDIRVQDKPRYKKPIGIYWLQAASVRLLDSDHLNEIWAYRVPSLAGATITVLATAAIGSLFFGPLTGIIAGLMMAGCLVLNMEARLAKTDAVLLSSIMVLQYALARTYIRSSKSWTVSFLFWTALGIGILIKGPIILLVLASTLLWLRFADKNLAWFPALRPGWGIPYLLLLTLPWFIAILMQSHGQFLQDSAGHDLLNKIWHGQDRGFLPPGLHLLIMPVVFFPFSIFVLLALPDSWANRDKPAYRFLIGWIIPFWIVFELSLTKLPHYVLPAYPAIAILAAQALIEGYPAMSGKRASWLTGLSVGIWLMVGTGLAVGSSLLPYLLGHTWKYGQILVSGILIISQSLTLFYIFKRKTYGVVIASFGALVFLTYTLGVTIPQIDYLWITRRVVQVANTFKQCPDVKIISATYDEPSLIFAAGTGTRFAAGGAEVADQMQQDRCLVGVLDKKHYRGFLNELGSKKMNLIQVAKVDGFNLGAGRESELAIYIAAPRLP